jgi:hypothetical protein
MRDYGKVYTAFWQSDDMREMSEDGRMLALYLMTCPHGNMLGCFRLSDAYAAEDMQWSSERVVKGFAELIEKGFAYRCGKTFWVFIRHFLKWNPFENPNVATKAFKLLETLRMPSMQKGLVINALREFGKHFDHAKLDVLTAGIEPFDNPFNTISKTIAVAIAPTIADPEPKPEPKPEPLSVERRDAPIDRDVIPDIFAYWQKTMASPSSKLDKKRIEKISAAIKLGYTPRQLCEAIKGCSLTPHNMGQNDRNTKFNGIGLIFRDADHIDRFIACAKNPPKAGAAETMEQRNARITAEVLDEAISTEDGDIIDMEACDEQA